PLLATRPARTVWTYSELAAAHVAPLITHSLPPLAGDDARALSAHRTAVESALVYACGGGTASEGARVSAAEMSALWRAAVAAHQGSDADAALTGYQRVLEEQPGFAPALYLSGLLLRDRGREEEAQAALTAALAAAPRYGEARAVLANLRREAGDAEGAATLCREGLALRRGEVSLWRALGLAELAQQRYASAVDAFAEALALEPSDGLTHYNQGVALQSLHRRDEALRAYQRALALSPEMIAADFNIGVIFHEQGRTDAAIGAF